MRKLVSVLLSIVMIFSFSFAFADTNLSDMSYDDLIALQRAVVKEIMSRPEWKEVVVPAGNWVVGVDIPAGTYSIRTEARSCGLTVWRKAIDDYSNNGLYYNEVIGKDKKDCGKIELSDGMVVCLSNDAIFSPPKSLGF